MGVNLTSRLRRYLNRGQLLLSAENTTLLSDTGTYYQINGTFVDSANNNFTTSASGELILTGESGWYAFNGVSNLKSDKVATITYKLYKNGNPVVGATTPSTFSNANSYREVSITNLIYLETNDALTIRANSDVVTTTITVYNLMVNLIGRL